jgi:large subunit ribosomal protein L9
MKVVLLQNVNNLGTAGDVVDVKPGYCRNYLIPQGLANILNKQALAAVEEIKRVALRKAENALEHAKGIAGRIEGQTIQIQGKVGKRGAKLYGSITSQALASALGASLEEDIDKRMISFPEPIRTLGMHEYVIKLHPEVVVTGKVEVIKKPEETKE